MAIKGNIKKIMITILSTILMLSFFTGTCIVSASQTVPASVGLVYLKIKAETEAGFSAPIDISYQGTSGNEFIITLTAENNYVTTIPVTQDAYTLKGASSPAGIDISIAQTFSLVNAEAGKIYILPVSVYQTEEVKETGNYNVTVSINASNTAKETGYTGQLSVTYAGTKGGSVLFTLTPENYYTQEVEVPADVYSLVSVTTENGYRADIPSSLDLFSVQKNDIYPCSIKLTAVPGANADATEEVVITEGFIAGGDGTDMGDVYAGKSKKGIVHLEGDNAGLTGDIIVTYTGERGYSFSVCLNNANSYNATISGEVPYDTYSLTQILQTVPSNHSLDAPAIYTVDDSAGNTFIINISVNDEDSGSGSAAKGIIIIITVIAAIVSVTGAFFAFKTVRAIKRNNKKK